MSWHQELGYHWLVSENSPSLLLCFFLTPHPTTKPEELPGDRLPALQVAFQGHGRFDLALPWTQLAVVSHTALATECLGATVPLPPPVVTVQGSYTRPLMELTHQTTRPNKG